MLLDQYAFRPTGSMTAALVDLLQKITNILQKNDYVVLFTVELTKAFDSVKHSPLLQKMEIPHSQLAGSLIPVPGPCHSTWIHHLSRSLYQRLDRPGLGCWATLVCDHCFRPTDASSGEWHDEVRWIRMVG